ncbi:MAG: hypothetical protein ACM3NN_04770 [Nitrospirota bacterium]
MKTTVQVFPDAQSSSLTFSLLGGKVLEITTLSKLQGLTIEDEDPQAATQIASILRRFLPALQPQNSLAITLATETAKADSAER